LTRGRASRRIHRPGVAATTILPVSRSWPKLTPRTFGLLVAFVFALALRALIPNPALAAGPSTPGPFTGTALWVTQIIPPQTGQQLAADAAAVGMRTLYVKAAEGSSAELQFSAALVAEMRAAGATVCAWTFAYGQSPSAEAAAAVTAVHDGAQCLVVDAEGQYDKLYGAAQLFVRALRSQLGAGFPIGLAGEAEILRHPTFPYSVFLGPGGFNVFLPELYWLELGVGVDAAYAATIGGDSLYGRPILPVGQIFGAPTAAEVTRFRALARAYGAPGLSFFDLDSAQPQALAALTAPLPRLAHRAIIAPTLHAGACGDEIVQAQELLDAAGAHLPVGGYFGAETERAVATFQSRHRLAPSGVLGPATWRALLRLHPREPSWAGAPPVCEQ
jgi:hypothetical protein